MVIMGWSPTPTCKNPAKADCRRSPNTAKADCRRSPNTSLSAGQPPQLVAVPTHFYKVILGEGPQAAPGSSPDTVVAGFVLPNQPIEPGAPLTAFAVPVSALEEVSGAAPALQLAKSRVGAEFRVQVCRARMSRAGPDRLLPAEAKLQDDPAIA